MKKMILPVTAIGMFLTSCGGWSGTAKDDFMKSCEKAEILDCKCALDKTMTKYPNQDDFAASGGKDMELAKDLATGCLKK